MAKKTLLLVVLLALAYRLPGIQETFTGIHAWNEAHYAMMAKNFEKNDAITPINDHGKDYTKPLLVPWLIRFSFDLLGETEYSARLPIFACGLNTLLILYLLAKKLYGEKTALFSTYAAAVFPATAYYSKNVQLEATSTMFALAALYILATRKKDPKKIPLSAFFFSAAFFSKYTTILILPAALVLWEKKERKKFPTWVFFSLLPGLAWITYGQLSSSGVSGYFLRKDAFGLASVSTSLAKYFTEYLPAHIGPIGMLFVLTGTILLAKNPKKHVFLATYTLSWYLLLFAYPQDFYGNEYYDYPALYGLATTAGIGMSWLTEQENRAGKQKILPIAAALFLLASSLATYENAYLSVKTKNPVEAAKIVAETNQEKKPVLARFPYTMYYAGADPAYIHLTYYDNNLFLEKIRSQNYSFVLVDTDAQIVRETLIENNYSEKTDSLWTKN